MLLNFTCEEYWNYSHEEDILLPHCKAYTIYRGEEVFGYFLFNSRRSYSISGENRYLFEYRSSLFRKSEYLISDLNTGEPVNIQFAMYSAHPFAKWVYLVRINHEPFQLFSEKPDTKFNLFYKETWRCEKYSLQSETNHITYEMSTTRASLLSTSVTEGTIESTTDNFLVIAAGFHLQEKWRDDHSG